MLTETELFEVLQERDGPLLRVELQPVYDVASDGDDLKRWLRGEPVPEVSINSGWTGVLHADMIAGRPWRKVHIIADGRPLTEYERFMFEWYFTRNAEAGEEIRILETESPVEQGLPDWYVLPDRRVVVCWYDAGYFVGAEIVQRSIATKPYRAMADLAWHHATPWDEWWAAHPQYRRGAAQAA
jgi:hypothetical protein